MFNANGGTMMPTSSSSTAAVTAANNSNNSNQSSSLKTYFKAAEGRYKLQYEKTHPPGLLHYAHGKTVSQVTLAHLKDKPTQAQPSTSSSSSSSSSSVSVTSGVRSAAARFLSSGNGNRALSLVGSNGGGKSFNGTKIGSSGISNPYSLLGATNFDGKGSYLIFNVGDAIFISDLNSQDKGPIKSIHFSNSNPVCHAFDPDTKDGNDLLVGLNSGEVLLVSLRQQLQDPGKKLVGALHFNKDGCITSSRCTNISWVPNGNGSFAITHADGNIYVYEKNRESSGDPSFPLIKDQTHFSVAHARYSKNPIARWHICHGSINNIAFSADGTNIATVGRDGYLRVFDFKNEQLLFGGKSYYGALLCCAWSMDGKYILTGGEDDLVHVWSMEDRKIVAWGEGHNSWVSGVAFDTFWSSPDSNSTTDNVVYRFGSVGQDTQLILWDLAMDEIVVPLRRAPGGSPTFGSGSMSSHWESASPVGTLQTAPRMRDIPKLPPLVAHRVHTEPLSGLIFAEESVLTTSREGHIKIWMRPDFENNSQSNGPNNSTVLKEKLPLSGKIGSFNSSSSYKQSL